MGPEEENKDHVSHNKRLAHSPTSQMQFKDETAKFKTEYVISCCLVRATEHGEMVDWRLDLTFRHRSFTFNSNKSPTWCNNFSVYYPDVCLQLNMIRAFSRPSSGAQWLQWQPLVLPLYRGDSRAVFVCAVGGVRHPQHTQTGSNSSTIAADSSNGVANTRYCRYSCMRSWWWVEVPPETCRAVSRYK